MSAAGSLSPSELYGHPLHGVLPQLRQLLEWARGQTSFQFFQSSVLILYDGGADSVAAAGVRVALVDFAHTFRTLGGARDENLAKALSAMIAMIEGVVAAGAGGSAGH